MYMSIRITCTCTCTVRSLIIIFSLHTGHSIQEASEDGESLLSLACSAGYYELAEVLLRMRASVEDRGIKGIECCVCVQYC